MMSATIAIASVISPPAPSPCSARNAISSPRLAAAPLSADPSRKTRMAPWKSRLRPYKSLIRPHSGIETVAPSMYAVTTQAIWSRPPRSRTTVGSAVDTIVWSSEASSIASSRPPKLSHNWRPVKFGFSGIRSLLLALEVYCHSKIAATIVTVNGCQHRTARAQEAADARADRRDGAAALRRARVRRRARRGDRGRGRGLREDGFQLLPDQGGPRLLAAG